MELILQAVNVKIFFTFLIPILARILRMRAKVLSFLLV